MVAILNKFTDIIIGDEGYDNFYRAVIRYATGNCTGKVKEFFDCLKSLKSRQRQHRRNILRDTGLNIPAIPIPTVYVRKLRTAYPPIGYWVADNVEIHDQWVKYLHTYKLSDKRHSRYPTMVVNSRELQLDVEETESAIYRDIETGEVIGVVIRNFASNPQILNWASDIVLQSTIVAKSIRVRIYITFNCYLY